jgi:hypothetical protein
MSEYPTIKDFVKPLPYVTPVKITTWCDGWKAKPDGKPKKCTDRAIYHFKKAASKGPGRHKTGYYCIRCLEKVLNYSQFERDRQRRATIKFQKEATEGSHGEV